MLRKLVSCSPAAAFLCSFAAYAQLEPVKRTVLQRVDVPGTGMTTVLVLVEVLPNGVVPRHTHPGIEAFYVVDGILELTINGQAPKTITSGNSAVNPAGVPHVGKAGASGAKLIATYVVEKDKPLVSPAP